MLMGFPSPGCRQCSSISPFTAASVAIQVTVGTSGTMPVAPPPPRATLVDSRPTFFGRIASTHQEPENLIFRAVEDADLIRQAARGAVEAYNLLVSRWEKRVYNYLLRI